MGQVNTLRKIKSWLLDSTGVRTKLMGIYILVAFFFAIWITYYTQSILHAYSEEQIREQAAAIARDIASRSTEYVLTDNFYGLQQIIEETMRNNNDILYLFFMDNNSTVIGSSLPEGISQELIDANVAGDKNNRVKLLKTEEGFVWDAAVPIIISETLTDGEIGQVRIGLSQDRWSKAIRSIGTSIFFSIVLITLIASVFVFILQKVITDPIIKLVQGTKAVAAGEFSYRVSSEVAKDEIGDLVEAFNQMAERLEISHNEMQNSERMRQILLEKVISIQEEERKRIAIELHDETGQCLTGLKLSLKSLEQSLPGGELKKRMSNLHQEFSDTLETIHDLILELRPKVLDEKGLVGALRHYTREYGNKINVGVNLDLDDINGVELNHETATSIFRIVQEAITNTAKYADASEISITAKQQNDNLLFIIEDDGDGFNVDEVASNGRKSLGLFGMKERATLIGGNLLIDSSPGLGTTVYLRVPNKEVIKND